MCAAESSSACSSTKPSAEGTSTSSTTPSVTDQQSSVEQKSAGSSDAENRNKSIDGMIIPRRVCNDGNNGTLTSEVVRPSILSKDAKLNSPSTRPLKGRGDSLSIPLRHDNVLGTASPGQGSEIPSYLVTGDALSAADAIRSKRMRISADSLLGGELQERQQQQQRAYLQYHQQQQQQVSAAAALAPYLRQLNMNMPTIYPHAATANYSQAALLRAAYMNSMYSAGNAGGALAAADPAGPLGMMQPAAQQQLHALVSNQASTMRGLQSGTGLFGYASPTSLYRPNSALLAASAAAAAANAVLSSHQLPSYETPPALGISGEDDMLPPIFNMRKCTPLATADDGNWLSEYLCFVRAECVEVFTASPGDVLSRNNSKKISEGQVGIRCRYCAHLPHQDRIGRSSSYPSSKSRIYQSLTMMLRDHFPRCHAMPRDVQDRFIALKSSTSQGATDSKRYWVESAESLGMVDTPDGISFK